MKTNTDGILMTISKKSDQPIYCDRCHNEIRDEFTYIDPRLAGWIPRGELWRGVKKTYWICHPCVTTRGNVGAVEDIEKEERKEGADL